MKKLPTPQLVQPFQITKLHACIKTSKLASPRLPKLSHTPKPSTSEFHPSSHITTINADMKNHLPQPGFRPQNLQTKQITRREVLSVVRERKESPRTRQESSLNDKQVSEKLSDTVSIRPLSIEKRSLISNLQQRRNTQKDAATTIGTQMTPIQTPVIKSTLEADQYIAQQIANQYKDVLTLNQTVDQNQIQKVVIENRRRHDYLTPNRIIVPNQKLATGLIKPKYWRFNKQVSPRILAAQAHLSHFDFSSVVLSKANRSRSTVR